VLFPFQSPGALDKARVRNLLPPRLHPCGNEPDATLAGIPQNDRRPVGMHQLKIISREPKQAGMDLMIVVPSHANTLIAQAGAEKVCGRSRGICFPILYVSIAKDYVGSSAMVITREAVRKKAVRVVTIPIIIVARIVIGDSDHFAGRNYGAVRNTASQTNSWSK